jgi:DNA polymerase-1
LVLKKAAFVFGTAERGATGSAFTHNTQLMLENATDMYGVEAEVILVSEDVRDAGKNKSSLGMEAIRAERPRVLSEIGNSDAEFVMCFGPVATACVFDKGNLVEGELLRQAHYPLGDKLPVYVTFSLEALAWKSGIAKWFGLDIAAAAQGFREPVIEPYTVLLPGTPEWERMPFDNYEVACSFDLETFPGLDPWHPEARIRMAVVTVHDKTFVVQATGSNIKYDYVWMRRFGYTINNMVCTSTNEHILDNTNPKHDLKSLTFMYKPSLGDYSKEHRDLVRERGGWEYVEDGEMYKYCAGDGQAGWAIAPAQINKLREDPELYRAHWLTRDLYAVLAEMEFVGVAVDPAENERLDVIYSGKLGGLRHNITAALGPINVNSTQQLAKALKAVVPSIDLSVRELAGVLGPGEEEEESTNRAVLEREAHKHPVIETVLEYRKYRTRHSTFIRGLADKHIRFHDDGFFVHPRFRTDVVDTYRLSSQNPNGQNIPRKDNDDIELSIKRQFISRFPGGEILEADQSQVEIRVAAMLANDRKMLEAIESGEDIHTSMAAAMLSKAPEDVTEEARQSCKHRTFLILYGGGAGKLARDLKISRRRAVKLINEYYETFSGLSEYISATKLQVKKSLEVTTIWGFKRRFAKPEHWNSHEGARIERQAFNTKVQNGAAGITYVSMIVTDRELRRRGLKSKLVLQVHDSLIVDVFPGERDIVVEIVRDAMETAAHFERYGANITVPLHCDVAVGPNWGEVVPLEN